MSVSAALGTAIGLVFVLAMVSLFCSGVTEAVANFTEKRAKFLLTGLRSMLDEEESSPAAADPVPTADTMHGTVKKVTDTEAALAKFTTAGGDRPVPGDLTLALFGHPLIRALQTRRVGGNIGKLRAKIRNPQYIPPKVFAAALMDTLLPDVPAGPDGSHNLLAGLEEAVQRLDGFPAQRSLLALIHQAEGDLTKLEASLEGWYDSQMGRISGWYKRWSKVVLGVAGFVVAVVINVDVIQVANTLYVNEPIRQVVVAQATSGTACQAETDPARQRDCAANQLAMLATSGIPIWYPDGCNTSHLSRCWNLTPQQQPDGWRFLLKLLGWAITAFAVSFGAPFWFDALSKLGSLRTSGPKPS